MLFTEDAVEKDYMDREIKNLFADCQSRCSPPLTNSDSTVDCLDQKNYKGTGEKRVFCHIHNCLNTSYLFYHFLNVFHVHFLSTQI